MKLFDHLAEKRYYETHWPQKVRSSKPYQPYLKAVFGDLKVLEGRTVLEVGAGECLHSRLMAEEHRPGFIVAMDLFSQRMLPMARLGIGWRLKFVAGDCYRLPFEDESVDIVYGCGILHHLPNLEVPVSEFHRVLKPGGRYFGMEPNFYCLLQLLRQALDRRSQNEYLIRAHKAEEIFRSEGFQVRLHYFWVRFPKLNNRFLTTCFAIQGIKAGCELQSSPQ